MANGNGKAVLVPIAVLMAVILAVVAIGVAYGRDNEAIRSVDRKVTTLEVEAKEDRANIATSLRELAKDVSAMQRDIEWIKRNGGKANG